MRYVAILSRATPALLAFGISCAGAQPSNDEELDFIARSKCVVMAALDGIAATPMKTAQDQNRFLILDPLDHRAGYVQCVLFDWDHRIHCEAASGFYEHKPGEPRPHYVGDAGLERLARLGFSTDDSKGNYVREYSLAGAADFPGIAEFMLRAMFEAYPAPGRLDIRVIAPDSTEARCTPTS